MKLFRLILFLILLAPLTWGQQQFVKALDSIAALKGASVNDATGRNIYIYEVGLYRWDSSSTATADDDTVVESTRTSTGRWLKDGIIAPGVGSLVRTYDSVAEMAADSSIVAGWTAYTRGYYNPGDGGGGAFYPTNTVVSTNLGTRIASATSGYSWERIREGSNVNVLWFGARPDGEGVTDDHAAIQDAMDSLIGTGGEVKLPGAAEKYSVSETLVINDDYIVIRGDHQDTSIIYYSGTTFTNVIEVAADKRLGIGIENITIQGGPDKSGYAKYCFYAPEFNTGSFFRNNYVNSGVGLIKIDQAYYADISNNRFERSCQDPEARGISESDWLTVYGIDRDDHRAPIHIATANSTAFNHNKIARVGSDLHGTNTAYCVIYLDGDSLQFDNNSIESVGKDPFVCYQKVIIQANGFTGSIRNLYMEIVESTDSLFLFEGRSKPSLSGWWLYNFKTDRLIWSYSPTQIVLSDSYIYRAELNRTKQIGTDEAGLHDVEFKNVLLVAGDRRTDATLNGETFNVFDTDGTSYPFGATDDTDHLFHGNRKNFPRKIDGYTVTDDTDADGAYIQITCGTFLRQEGDVVAFRHTALEATNQIVMRLRPTTVSKYWRLYVGRGGQPYLKNFSSAQTTVSENWIAEFDTDGSGAIQNLVDNPRLSLRGNYIQGTSSMITQGTGSPEGVVTGSPGDIYMRLNGSPGSILYVKESGSATKTGWSQYGTGVRDLTDGATINTDASRGTLFRVTLEGNRTLATPTNPKDGQVATWEFVQDAIGNRTITLSSGFVLTDNVPSMTLSTTSGAHDFMTAAYNSTASKWYVLSLSSVDGGGDVVGPSSSNDNGLAVFDGMTGKLLKDGGGAISISTTNSQHHGISYNHQVISTNGFQNNSLGVFEMELEGVTADEFELTITMNDPDADYTQTYPNASGTYALQEWVVGTQTGTNSTPTATTPLAPTWTGPMHTVWYGATGEIDLPAAAGYEGRALLIYNTGSFTITVDPNASEIIVRDGTVQTGGVSFTLDSGAGNYVSLLSDGERWITLGYKGTLAEGS